MIQLSKDGRIIPPPDYGNRTIAVLTLWDAIISREKGSCPARIAMSPLANACLAAHQTTTDSAWRQLIAIIDAGNTSDEYPGWKIPGAMKDLETGKDVFIQLHDWKLSLFTLTTTGTSFPSRLTRNRRKIYRHAALRHPSIRPDC